VEVRTGSRVTRIAHDHVCIGADEVIETETVIWAAGVIASAAGSWLPCETDAAGRVVVDPHLRVAGAPDVFAIGDTALSLAWDGAAVPGLAPAAKQQGSYVASVIEAELFQMGEPPEPFVYRHQGSLATIGRKQAVADFGRIRLSGALAWWLWGVVHVGFLTGSRNRATVLLNWVWHYFTHQAGIRLITGRGQAM
jgi:NADH dehydrogenase/putative oxidoreductase